MSEEDKKSGGAGGDLPPIERPESPSDLENLKVKIVMVCKFPQKLTAIKNFLDRRGWTTFLVKEMGELISILSSERPEFVMVSVNHPSPKIQKLPMLLAQTFNTTTIAFAEEMDRKSVAKVESASIRQKLVVAPSGPAIHRKIKQILTEIYFPEEAQREREKELKELGKTEKDYIMTCGMKSSGEQFNPDGTLRFKKDEGSPQLGAKSFDAEAFEKLKRELVSPEGESTEPLEKEGALRSGEEAEAAVDEASGKTLGGEEETGLNEVDAGTSLTEDEAYGMSERGRQKKERPEVIIQESLVESSSGTYVQKSGIKKQKGYAGEQEPGAKNHGAHIEKRKKMGPQSPWIPREAEDEGALETAPAFEKEKPTDEGHSAQTKFKLNEPPGEASHGKKSEPQEFKLDGHNGQVPKAAAVAKEAKSEKAPTNLNRDNLEKLEPKARSETEAIFESVRFALDSITRQVAAQSKHLVMVDQMVALPIRGEQVSGLLVVGSSVPLEVTSEFVAAFKAHFQDHSTRSQLKLLLSRESRPKVTEVDFKPWIDSVGLFLYQRFHKTGEVGVGLLQFDRVEAQLNEAADKEKLIVNPADITPEMPLHAKTYLYLEKNQKYFLLVNEGAEISATQRERLIKQGKDLFIDKRDLDKFGESYVQSLLMSSIQNFKSKIGRAA